MKHLSLPPGVVALVAGALVATGLLLHAYDAGQAEVAQVLYAVAAIPVLSLILPGAWRSIQRDDLHGTADLLVLIVAVAAWAAGDLLTAVAVPLTLLAGHVLEERSLRGSREAIAALEGLRRSQARRIRGGVGEEVDAEQLVVGDLIELLPGDRIPADGRISTGRSHVASAAVTGESLPVAVGPGDSVLAGGVNHEGVLRLVVERAGDETVLGAVQRLLAEAEAIKPPAVRVLERYAGIYLPVVLVIAAAAGFATNSLTTALAVVIAACPCALALAAPATAVIAIAAAARRGMLLSAGAVLERLAVVDSLIIDKTGTLTRGSLELASIIPVPGVAPARVLALAASLAAGSRHPVSRAIAEAHPDQESASDIVEHPGLGITGTVGGIPGILGRPELLGDAGILVVPPPDEQRTLVAVAGGGQLVGWLAFVDPLRPEAASALADLRALGLAPQVILSGDRQAVVGPVARTVGADDGIGGLLPAEKLARLRLALAEGRRPLVIGDGINDALMLRAGAVGVAMGRHAAGAALAASDAVLTGDDLRCIPAAVRLARRAGEALHLAIILAMLGTAVLIAVAAAGLVGPLVTALLHNGIGLVVLVVAARASAEHPASPLVPADDRLPVVGVP